MSKGLSIGILGGGQLGRMLWESSARLAPNLNPSVIFHDSKKCSAGFGGAPIVEGSINDVKKLAVFFKSIDTFAIENEFLPLTSIETAWAEAEKPVGVPRPSIQSLEIAQDKFEQKKFFQRQGFPTSEFVEFTAEKLAKEPESIRTLRQQWQGLVLKKARMGYDGKGNLALPPGAVGSSISDSIPEAFCKEAFSQGSRVYAERFIPFQREVALVAVRSHSGDYGHYPLIETVQKNGVCLLAFTAQACESLQKKAVEISRQIGEQLALLGTYAVEFFVTESGELLVNEMAPRVHNSGHFTQSGARCSQFEMHLKSYYLKTFDPTDFECAPAFAMINLLGPSDVNGPVHRPVIQNSYWYDKERTSPGRKLGHIIAQSSNPQELPELIRQLKESEQRWKESIKQL